MSFLVTCFFLRANGFIEEAVNQLEVEYTDSEEELFPVQAAGSKEKGRQRRETQEVIETIVEQKSVQDTHNFTISDSVEYFVKFEVPEKMIEMYEQHRARNIFQVNVESLEANEEFPVDITIKQFHRMITFQLPTVERKAQKLVYSSNERSVDFCPIEHIDSNSTVTVSMSTQSKAPVDVTIRVLLKGRSADWKQTEDQNGVAYLSKTTIKPVISRIRFFDTKLLDTDSIIVKVTTRNDTDCMCSIISIQHPACPFYDDIGSAMRFGQWSTMMDQGTIIIDPEEYPEGFILVLVASAHGDICGTTRCNDQHNLTDPRKRVKISVGSNGSDYDYIMATMAVISLYIAIFILTITFSILEFRYKYSDFEQVKEKVKEKIKNIDMPTIDLPDFRQLKKGYSIKDGLKKADIGIFDVSELVTSENILINVENDSRNNEMNCETESVSAQNSSQIILRENDQEKETASLLERNSFAYIDNYEADDSYAVKEGLKDWSVEGGPMIASTEDVKDIVMEVNPEDVKIARRTKKLLCVADLSTKLGDPTRTKSVYQKSQLYLGVLFLISIYYSLPVLQMVFRFSAEQSLTGNQDICYYNDLCRKPLGPIRDFNHVFSNLGYCVFGLLFMCIVLFKKLKYESFLAKNTTIDGDEYGVPTQYGLYFAMGLALFMEGIMSSSYHVCPTNVTFQFDTTFMYLLAVLMFMKLYQVRHSDVSANAIGVFFGLGVALFLETIALYYSGPWFWAFFCTVYIIVIVVVSVHAFNLGVIKYDYKIVCVVARILYSELKNLCENKEGGEDKKKGHPRLLCLLLICLINITVCLYFGISATPGASNYLLAIFFLNLTMYGSYYCVMKILSGERVGAIPIIYANLGLLCFLPAMYFFTQKEKMSELSPAESRDMNVDCIFLNFYDGHDIWHFLGAAGVFFAFLCIFTLDEDLTGKKRDAIHVF